MMVLLLGYGCIVFFFNDTATTEIYTLSLHDALPIYELPRQATTVLDARVLRHQWNRDDQLVDRKSTRLNSSHSQISYAVFCLKKKKPIHEFFNHDHPTCRPVYVTLH